LSSTKMLFGVEYWYWSRKKPTPHSPNEADGTANEFVPQLMARGAKADRVNFHSLIFRKPPPRPLPRPRAILRQI
jgi:hypothetical protein